MLCFFWVELHLDVVLGVLQVVGSQFLRMIALLMTEIFELKKKKKNI